MIMIGSKNKHKYRNTTLTTTIMNIIKEINQINEKELANGSVNTSASWHNKYAHSAWIYTGNLPTQLTEGDILCVFSQYGEIEDIHLVRDNGGSSHKNDDKNLDQKQQQQPPPRKAPPTGRSKGFCFLKYEDARSCILAVDNLNGSKILQRPMRVDHVEQYRLPKEIREKEEEELVKDGIINKNSKKNGGSTLLEAGHMYKGEGVELVDNGYDIHKGQDLFASMEEKREEERLEALEQRRREKEVRKRERDLKRQEKAERKERREEKRRLKRSRKLAKEEQEDDSNDDDNDQNRVSKKSKKADKKKRRRKRYDSDDESDQSGSNR